MFTTIAILALIVVVLALIGLTTLGLWESPLAFGWLFGGWNLLGVLVEGLFALVGALMSQD